MYLCIDSFPSSLCACVCMHACAAAYIVCTSAWIITRPKWGYVYFPVGLMHLSMSSPLHPPPSPRGGREGQYRGFAWGFMQTPLYWALISVQIPQGVWNNSTRMNINRVAIAHALILNCIPKAWRTYIQTYKHTTAYPWPTVCDPMPRANTLGNNYCGQVKYGRRV